MTTIADWTVGNELAEELLSLGFTQVSKENEKPRFKKGKVYVTFDHMYVNVTYGNGIVYSQPELSNECLRTVEKLATAKSTGYPNAHTFLSEVQARNKQY